MTLGTLGQIDFSQSLSAGSLIKFLTVTTELMCPGFAMADSFI